MTQLKYAVVLLAPNGADKSRLRLRLALKTGALTLFPLSGIVIGEGTLPDAIVYELSPYQLSEKPALSVLPSPATAEPTGE